MNKLFVILHQFFLRLLPVIEINKYKLFFLLIIFYMIFNYVNTILLNAELIVFNLKFLIVFICIFLIIEKFFGIKW